MYSLAKTLFELSLSVMLQTSRIFRFLVLVFTTISFGVQLTAQDYVPEDEVHDLDPVTVYADASLFESSIDSGQSVAFLSNSDWIREGAKDLVQAIGKVPGVTVSRYNPVGSFGGSDGGGIFIRGHGSNRPGSDFSITTDGVPRFVGIWSHPLVDLFPVEFYEEIQIYKSPQPVNVGNMGFAAINLVPLGQNNTQDGKRLRFSVGEWDTYAVSVLLTDSLDSTNIQAGFSHRESDGHRPSADGEVTAGVLGVQFSIDASTLSLYLEHSHSRASDPEQMGTTLPITEKYETEDTFGILKWESDLGALNYTIKAYAEKATADWSQWHVPPPPPFPAQELNTQTDFENWGLQLNTNLELNEELALESGLQFIDYGGIVREFYQISPNSIFPETRYSRTDLYSNLLWKTSPANNIPISASAGLRYSWGDPTENAFGTQAGIVAKLRDNLSLFLNAASGFNAVGPYINILSSKWRIDNPSGTLDNERILHGEFGMRLEKANLHFQISMFHDSVKDGISLSAPPNPSILNLGEYAQYGIELHANWKISETLSTFVAATWTNPDSKRPNNPKWTTYLSMEWAPSNEWQLELSHQYLSDRYTQNARFSEPLEPVDAFGSASFHLHFSPEKLRAYQTRLSMHIENLFDENYEHRQGYPMPGRNFMISLQTRF